MVTHQSGIRETEFNLCEDYKSWDAEGRHFNVDEDYGFNHTGMYKKAGKVHTFRGSKMLTSANEKIEPPSEEIKFRKDPICSTSSTIRRVMEKNDEDPEFNLEDKYNDIYKQCQDIQIMHDQEHMNVQPEEIIEKDRKHMNQFMTKIVPFEAVPDIKNKTMTHIRFQSPLQKRPFTGTKGERQKMEEELQAEERAFKSRKKNKRKAKLKQKDKSDSSDHKLLFVKRRHNKSSSQRRVDILKDFEEE